MEIRSWLETPAAAVRQVMGYPLPSERELAFAAEYDQREADRQAFNDARRPGEARPARTVYERQQQLAAERIPPGADWIPVTDGDGTAIIRRMHAQQLANRAAADATVYGPGDGGNPRTVEALEKIRAANERIADVQRGGPYDPDNPAHWAGQCCERA
jgi:hypothetical protein